MSKVRVASVIAIRLEAIAIRSKDATRLEAIAIRRIFPSIKCYAPKFSEVQMRGLDNPGPAVARCSLCPDEPCARNSERVQIQFKPKH